jgi:OOP family OmpA-OmpF porin
MLKKVALAAAIASVGLSASAFAVTDNGLYAGLQLGQSRVVDIPNTLPWAGADVDKNNFAGRVYLGYQFNKYISTELGYEDLGTVDINHILHTPGMNSSIKQQAGDLIAKASLPIGDHFNVFALGGGAYADFSQDNNNLANYSNVGNKGEVSGIRPTYGVGASYDVNRKLSLDLSWRQIYGGSDVQSVNFTGVGLAYHFA